MDNHTQVPGRTRTTLIGSLIAVAGRQRMLTQRIALSSLSATQADESAQNNHDLRNGSVGRNLGGDLPAETLWILDDSFLQAIGRHNATVIT
ncbi:MAG: type IV pili methyl-accepting chemotaxis transducer N-terminal domain-containing protein [Actinomycetota bacterium]